MTDFHGFLQTFINLHGLSLICLDIHLRLLWICLNIHGFSWNCYQWIINSKLIIANYQKNLWSWNEQNLIHQSIYICVYIKSEIVVDANKVIELNPKLAKAYLRKGIACMNLEECYIAKSTLEKGSSLVEIDSRFTKLIEECDKSIAEENNDIAKPLSPDLTRSFTFNEASHIRQTKIQIWILPKGRSSGCDYFYKKNTSNECDYWIWRANFDNKTIYTLNQYDPLIQFAVLTTIYAFLLSFLFYYFSHP